MNTLRGCPNGVQECIHGLGRCSTLFKTVNFKEKQYTFFIHFNKNNGL